MPHEGAGATICRRRSQQFAHFSSHRVPSTPRPSPERRQSSTRCRGPGFVPCVPMQWTGEGTRTPFPEAPIRRPPVFSNSCPSASCSPPPSYDPPEPVFRSCQRPAAIHSPATAPEIRQFDLWRFPQNVTLAKFRASSCFFYFRELTVDNRSPGGQEYAAFNSIFV